MKSIMLTGCIVVFFVSMTGPVWAVPLKINYQGMVETGDEAFSGTGLFRFAIVDATGSVTYWSNDGNSVPATDIPIVIENGLIQVILGDAAIMDEIPASVFDNDEIYLRIWFDDGVTGLQQLSPDQQITSVGFALKAESASDADTLNGKADSFFQNASNINAGTLNTSYFSAYSDLGTEGYLDNSAGTDLLTRTQSDARYVNEAQADSVSSAMIVNGTVIAADLEDGTALAEILDDDGAGSTLDADTIDGLNSLQFLRSDVSDTMNGTLTVTGNLGIGTLTPETDLHVKSDSGNAFMLVESGTDNQAAFRCSTASYDWIAGVHGGNFGTFKISNATSFGTNDFFTITTAGNVGIGTTSPDGTLEVSHNGTSSDLFIDGTSGSVGIGTASPTGTLLVSHNGSSADLFIDGTSGNVGIGTDAPQTNIHARSPGGDCKIFVESGTESDSVIRYRADTENTDWTVGLDGSDYFKFKISSSSDLGTNDYLTVTKAGRVGINDSAPGKALSVNGGAAFTGKIEANSLSVNGELAGAGVIAGDTLNINGDANIYGEIEGQTLYVSNNTTIDGDIVGNSALYVTNLPYADAGNAQWDTTTHQFCYDTSSRRFKENITPFEDHFENLLQAEPMTYTRPNNPDRHEIGFIAEDFLELGLDRLLYFDENGDPFSINYSKISLYLLEIIKTQENKIQSQEEQLKELTQRLERIEAALSGN